MIIGETEAETQFWFVTRYSDGGFFPFLIVPPRSWVTELGPEHSAVKLWWKGVVDKWIKRDDHLLMGQRSRETSFY